MQSGAARCLTRYNRLAANRPWITESIQWPFSAESAQHPRVQQSMPLEMENIEFVTSNSHAQRLMGYGKLMKF